MHYAARHGDIEAVKVLCEQGANINMTNDVSCYFPVVV